MDAPIATFEGIAIDQGGTRFPFKVSIGTPYLRDHEPHTWACPVSVEPLDTHIRDIFGGDSFQALCLASRIALELLRSFIERGGRLTYDGDEDLSLDAYLSPSSLQSRGRVAP